MVFITGASSGIGEACAFRFAKEGHSLILMARRKERLEALKFKIENEHDVDVTLCVGDVCDRPALLKWIQANEAVVSKTAVLINNAGLAKGLSTLQEGSPGDWEVMIDTNVKGLLNVTHALLPFLLKKNEGHIINMGSVAGRWAYPKGNVYCASKAAIALLNEGLRMDLNGTGIRVTEIAPGMVETEFSMVRLEDAAKAKAVYSGLDPLTAADIADAVYWCASRPKRVNIQEMVIYPTDQASPGIVHRKS